LRQISIILIVLFTATGCATIGSGRHSVIKEDEGRTISSYNISDSDFFIERADIEFTENGSSEKFMVNIKYIVPGNYLVSIRSKTGIEAARVFIKKDSVFVNDRMNQIFYYGSANELTQKWGISASFIPVIFGDLILNMKQDVKLPDCSGESNSFAVNLEGRMCRYVLDCKEKKIVLSEIETDNASQKISMNFDKFVNFNSNRYPSLINLTVESRNISLEMKIRKISFDSDSEIRFVPGNRYEKVVLK